MNMYIYVNFGKILLICALWNIFTSVFDSLVNICFNISMHMKIFLISLYIKRIKFINCICNLWFIWSCYYIKFYKSWHWESPFEVVWGLPLEAMWQPPLEDNVPQSTTHNTKCHMQTMYFLKMISEVVMSYYLLSRYLHAYVEPFDMCGLSFEISLWGKSSTGDLGSLCDM